MVTVTLSNANLISITLEKILDYVVTKNTPIPKKTVRDRSPPTTEAEHYTDYPREIILECRLTSAQKAILYNLDDDKLPMLIKEDGVTVYSCWLEDIDIKYEITEHHDYSWRTTLKFVVCAYAVGDILPPAWAYIDVVGGIWMIELGGYLDRVAGIAFFAEMPAPEGDDIGDSDVWGGAYVDRV